MKFSMSLKEWSSNYSDMTCSLWFYSKNEATSFDANITSTDAFKSFKYEPKVSGNTVINGVKGILEM